MRQLLQTIPAFVYCNSQVPPAADERLNAPMNSAYYEANTFDRQLNSTKIILFHFMMELYVK